MVMIMIMVMVVDTTLLDNPHLGPSHFDHPRFGAKRMEDSQSFLMSQNICIESFGQTCQQRDPLKSLRS